MGLRGGKRGFNRTQAGEKRQAEIVQLQQTARTRVIVVNGKKRRVQMYVCPPPMECSDLGINRRKLRPAKPR